MKEKIIGKNEHMTVSARETTANNLLNDFLEFSTVLNHNMDKYYSLLISHNYMIDFLSEKGLLDECTEYVQSNYIKDNNLK